MFLDTDIQDVLNIPSKTVFSTSIKHPRRGEIFDKHPASISQGAWSAPVHKK